MFSTLRSTETLRHTPGPDATLLNAVEARGDASRPQKPCCEALCRVYGQSADVSSVRSEVRQIVCRTFPEQSERVKHGRRSPDAVSRTNARQRHRKARAMR